MVAVPRAKVALPVLGGELVRGGCAADDAVEDGAAGFGVADGTCVVVENPVDADGASIVGGSGANAVLAAVGAFKTSILQHGGFGGGGAAAAEHLAAEPRHADGKAGTGRH